MVTVSTLLPVAESVAGVNEQRLAVGSPEQAKLTVELNPFTIATLTVVFDAGRKFAGMTIWLLETEKVKSGTGGAATTIVATAEVDVGYVPSPL